MKHSPCGVEWDRRRVLVSKACKQVVFVCPKCGERKVEYHILSVGSEVL